ncbi:neutral zinc metallopeptidase [Saccharopolyspora sp. HNM0983]|uniref:Neutral zinc metallopeptidase n=2 Tax=Saccharopolyspora montiporae TaxID=2781240 RepID=A0A929BCV7_9PSEU|nr:neutral zinc metallopeptidase [Saccharopolyspora sp. HNM0983]
MIVALVLATTCLFVVGVVGVFLAGGGTDTTASSDGSETSRPQHAPPPPPNTSTQPPSSAETSSTAPSSDTSDPSEPRGEPRAVPALADHPLYISGNGAPATSCQLPPFAPDAAGQDALYQAALPCLMDAWEPMLDDANMPVQTPRVVTTDEGVQSPCGAREWHETAMYCRSDHTIYMSARYYSDIERRTEPGAYLGQFAHEFGHAVQGMVGINAAFGDAQARAGGPETPRGLELTRRSELQASCFEGMALAALQNGGLSNDYIFPALADSKDRGDEHTGGQDHGSLANNATWIDRGFLDNDITRCNTWAAAPDDVG